MIPAAWDNRVRFRESGIRNLEFRRGESWIDFPSLICIRDSFLNVGTSYMKRIRLRV